MSELELKDFHDLIMKVLETDSISVLVDSGDESVDTDREPDSFVHYELTKENPRGLNPVEHDDPTMIPVTDTSVVVAVWSEGKKEYHRYYDCTRFKDRYFN